MLSRSLVLIAVVLIASQLGGSEPAVELEFQNENGVFIIEMPTASVGKLASQPAFPLAELKPVLALSSPC